MMSGKSSKIINLLKILIIFYLQISFLFIYIYIYNLYKVNLKDSLFL